MDNKLLALITVLILVGGIDAILLMKYVKGSPDCACPASGDLVITSDCTFTTNCLLSQNSRLDIVSGHVNIAPSTLVSVYGGFVLNTGAFNVPSSSAYVVKEPY